MEYMSFMAQFQDEVKQGSHFGSDGRVLWFDVPTGETIRYQLEKRELIRSVRKEGEQTFKGRTMVLQHVYFISFVAEQGEVIIDLGLQNWYRSLEVKTTIKGRVEPDEMEE